MIKAIIFDWAGVLIDNYEEEFNKYCANSLDVKPKLFRKIFSKYKSEFGKGNISEKELWKKICYELKIDNSPQVSLWGEAVKKIFTDKKGMYHLVAILKKNKYKVGILSNTEIPAMEYFYNNQYDRYFDAVIFSCAERMIKPEKSIYLLALKKLGVEPKEALFIDDRRENVLGAEKLGINGILFKDLYQLRKEFKKFSIKTD